MVFALQVSSNTATTYALIAHRTVHFVRGLCVWWDEDILRLVTLAPHYTYVIQHTIMLLSLQACPSPRLALPV